MFKQNLEGIIDWPNEYKIFSVCVCVREREREREREGARRERERSMHFLPLFFGLLSAITAIRSLCVILLTVKPSLRP